MTLDSSTLLVGSTPAFCMFAFTLLGLHIKVPHDLAGALQHFAAGLLLSAVGTELLPTLLQASGFVENAGATIGFASGMATLIVLSAIFSDEDGEDKEGEEWSDEHKKPQEQKQRLSLLRRRASIRASSAGSTLNESIALLEAPDSTRSLSYQSDARSSSKSTINSNNKTLRLSFLAAIVVDAFMDGFLVGIAGAAGKEATIILAGSLSVEMSFVGITLANACHGMPYSQSIFAALAGPISLVGGTVIGSLVTLIINGHPSLFAGIMGFGVSALLFMVAEELLLEAHENGRHVWWVDIQLYTGFYFGFMSTKFLG